MPASDTRKQPETNGNDARYPGPGDFVKLLNWHLNRGTRPDGDPERVGEIWDNKRFANAVGASDKTVRNWRAGRNPPQSLVAVEQELFGANPKYERWRADLRTAFAGESLDGDEPKSNFPRPTASFLGRDEDLAKILTALAGEGAEVALLLQGGPGIGKTTLTQVAAWDEAVVKRFGARRWFVKLETARTAAALQDAVTRAVGADPRSGFAATLEALKRAPGLLVLDNLETPWDTVGERQATEAILAELATVPGLALMASIRGRDRVGGAAWSLVLPVEQLRPPHDRDLFCRIGGEAFAEDPHLQDLLKALAGIPLAIKLVATRAHGRDALAPLWAEWQRIGAALAASRDLPADRLTSLPFSVALSLTSERLDETALRLFRLLGQLPAGLCDEDRAALLGAESFAAEEALLGVGLAIEQGGRLDLLPPIRDIAQRRHRPEGEDAEAWPSYFLRLTKDLGEVIGTTQDRGSVARLVPELPNIEAAVREMLASDRRNEVMAALPGLCRLTYLASLPTPVLMEMSAARRNGSDILGEANCIEGLGDIALTRSDHDGARSAFEEAQLLYRQVGDIHGEANCICSLGEIALARSDHHGARAAYEEAQALYRQVGDIHGAANCIKGLGDIAVRRSDHDGARVAYEEAQPLYREVGSIHGEANCIKGLGNIALRRSNHDGARAAFEEAQALYRQVGDLLGAANCIKGLGDIALERSDHDGARSVYEEAQALYRQVGDLLGAANCIKGLGDIALRRSDHDGARAAYEEAQPLFRQVGSVLGEANCIKGLGDIALRRSNHNGARVAYEEAQPLFRQVGSILGEANCIKGLGDIALRRSDHDGARAAYEEAQPLYRQVGSILGEANCIKGLGDIALACSDHDGARTAYEEALLLYRKIDALDEIAGCQEKLKLLQDRVVE